MQGVLTITDGGAALRKTINGVVLNGSFYNWPMVGKQLTMFLADGEGLETLTSAEVIAIHSRNDRAMDFSCKDGRFTLRKISDADGVLSMC
jgi:hypothetical protein